MNAAEALASYQAMLAEVGETVSVRRFSGAPPSRTSADTSATGRVMDYRPHELTGLVQQGDRKVILLVDALGALLPLTTADKLVVRSREMAIIAIDDNTRRIGGTLIALELQARG